MSSDPPSRGCRQHALADVLGSGIPHAVRASQPQQGDAGHPRAAGAPHDAAALALSRHFDYCSLLDDHSKLVDLLENGRQTGHGSDRHASSLGRARLHDGRFGVSGEPARSRRCRPISAKQICRDDRCNDGATAQCGGRRSRRRHAAVSNNRSGIEQAGRRNQTDTIRG